MRSLATYLVVLATVYSRSISAASSRGSCFERTILCADGNGNSPRYLKCVQGQFVQDFCPPGSICVGSRDTTIFCAPSDSRSLSNTTKPTSAPALISISSFNPAPAPAPAPDRMTRLSRSISAAPISQRTKRRIRPKAISSPVQVLVPSPSPSLSPSLSQLKISASLLSACRTTAATPALPLTALPVATIAGKASPTVTIYSSRLTMPISSQIRSSLVDIQKSIFSIQGLCNSWKASLSSIQHSGAYSAAVGSASPLPSYSVSLVAPISLTPAPVSSHMASTWQLPRDTNYFMPQIPSASSPLRLQQSPQVADLQPELPPLPTAPAIESLLGNAATSSIASIDDRIGGIAARSVISVIGNVILSQRNTASSTPTCSSTITDTSSSTATEIGQVERAQSQATNSAPSTDTRSILPIVPQAAPEIVRNTVTGATEGVIPYIPYRIPSICSPGTFLCEAHGLRPGFFACDAGGFALPAACASNEVCYQYGKSILCDLPGGGSTDPSLGTI